MKRTLSGILFIFLIYTQICSQIINKEPLSPRITGYNIEATLDPSEKTVTGNMEAFWVNTSTGSVPDVQLHMYMNAFRSDKSTFSRESRHTHWMGNSYDGYIDITSCTDRQGNELLSRLQYISPDDGNPDDSTVLRIDLPEPAMPGDTVFLKIKFVTGLPSEIIRTGYSGDFFFVAQWFPKFGVYEPAGMRYRK